MLFLNATNPQTINLMRTGMVDIGFKAQRLANQVLQRFARKQSAKPPATLGAAPIKEQVIHFINKKMPGHSAGAKQYNTPSSAPTRIRPPTTAGLAFTGAPIS